MLRDISERKTREKELIKIRTALDNSSDAIAMTDANRNVVYQNQAFLNLFGYTADGINEKGITNVYKDSTVANAVLQAIKSGKKWDGEIKILSKDGRESTCLLSASPILEILTHSWRPQVHKCQGVATSTKNHPFSKYILKIFPS